jgi:hypothetical protein
MKNWREEIFGIDRENENLEDYPRSVWREIAKCFSHYILYVPYEWIRSKFE